jgi:hypothetical protein
MCPGCAQRLHALQSIGVLCAAPCCRLAWLGACPSVSAVIGRGSRKDRPPLAGGDRSLASLHGFPNISNRLSGRRIAESHGTGAGEGHADSSPVPILRRDHAAQCGDGPVALTASPHQGRAVSIALDVFQMAGMRRFRTPSARNVMLVDQVVGI